MAKDAKQTGDDANHPFPTRIGLDIIKIKNLNQNLHLSKKKIQIFPAITKINKK